jgi:predicted AAA+ superfamily ATPase
MIKRTISDDIVRHMFSGKAILIYGARQTGKSTLVELILENRTEKVLRINGDDSEDKALLGRASKSMLKSLTAGYDILFIDEAQKIDDIGNIIKIFTDQIKEVQVIATGSSSFELLGKTSESLTGRKYEYTLYPFLFSELIDHHGLLSERALLENRLIYGSYPEVVVDLANSMETIKLISGSYLYKDILMIDKIRNSSLIETLLKALALQVGSEVSFSELSRLTGADRGTIEKYVRILEDAFILFRLSGFSRNVRTELRKSKKFYFWDNGVRNAIIGNFNPLDSRSDTGALWENYIVSERLKLIRSRKELAFTYFWRTTLQQEIDLIEERQGNFSAFEMKFNPKQKGLIPQTFLDNYKISETAIVNRDNYQGFLYPERFREG